VTDSESRPTPQGAVEPTVSIVIVNYRGADDTIACIAGLSDLDWPTDKLEVIVVDNASGDDSVARIRTAAPHVTLIAAKKNTGFAGGCNRGAAAAAGVYLAFLNNDARPDARWLTSAVPVLERRPGVACVASKVLDWEGQEIDFAAASLSFYGHAFKMHAGDTDLAGHDEEADVLFASGAAMVIDAKVFARVGGFDERYFMFFEDVDLGWRLWLLGYEVRYVPASFVYHRHHASMAEVGSWREHFLLERNALYTIYKNYDDENLRAVMPAALALTVGRSVARGGDDPHMLEVTRATALDAEHVSVHKETLAGTFAVDAFLSHLDELAVSRRELQATRRRSDADILPLFRQPFLPNSSLFGFRQKFAAAVSAFDVEQRFGPRRRIVVATGDTLEPAMAGPAIRAWQIARALSREHDVELVSTTRCAGLSHPDFRVRKVNGHQLRKLVDWCDIVIFQGYIMFENPAIAKSSKVVVADIYDPFHLEQLEQTRDLAAETRRDVVRSSTDVLNEQLARGDLFLCASAKQRDFWLGQLAAVGRINPVTYDDGESLERLLCVVPFGVSDTAPVHTRPVLRGVVPGIGDDAKIILWGGGVYNWFDPISLLRAVDKLRARMPEVCLYFLGMKHPNPHVPEMRMAVRTRELADELGLTGTHVFFNEGWVEYDERQNFLLESDVGVSTHLDHVETEFSFRTRILDYLWAGLPVVATAGDSFAELIEARGVGRTVPAEDVDALEEALYTLLSDAALSADCGRAAFTVADEFKWSTVLAPLVEFCRAPRRAPDLVLPEMAELVGLGRSQVTRPLRLVHWRDDLRTFAGHLRRGELKTMVRKAARRAKQVISHTWSRS
jgi:GT2 family glycosyltransferase/glycosyltransferase involved in cell wall biosynthesis